MNLYRHIQAAVSRPVPPPVSLWGSLLSGLRPVDRESLRLSVRHEEDSEPEPPEPAPPLYVAYQEDGVWACLQNHADIESVLGFMSDQIATDQNFSIFAFESRPFLFFEKSDGTLAAQSPDKSQAWVRDPGGFFREAAPGELQFMTPVKAGSFLSAKKISD